MGTLLAIAASPIAKGSATAEPTADADAFFGRNFYQPQQQWGPSSYSNNWNMRYNPQMWGTQSGYFNNHFNKRSADAEPTADADAFFGRSYYQPQQQWGLTGYSNNWNQRYNPQMWGTQSSYFNNHFTKRSADAEPKADADAFFGRSFYQPQQQWGLNSYSNNWNMRYTPQMWGTQSGYFNNHFTKRSADAEPKADA